MEILKCMRRTTMNDGTLIISCMGDTKNTVEDLINSAIGEWLVDCGLYFEWDEANLQFTVYCKDKKEKYNLVNYIWTWLNEKDKDYVSFFNPPASKDSINNKKVYDYILEDWK